MGEKKNALVVAGGPWQVPIIRFLQKKNYCVFVADPYSASPGVLVADGHIRADVRDVQSIMKLMVGRKFELVTGDQSDIAVETVAILASHLNLRGNKVDAVKKFTNKFLSRQFAREQKIPVPEFYQTFNTEEVRKAIAENGLPVIIKPVDSQSSRGVLKVDQGNVGKLEELVSLTFKETRENYILTEEFFEGVELTMEGICSNGKHKTLAISSKKHFRMGIASDLQYPAELPEQVEAELVRCNDKYVDNSGLDFGITHAEYLYHAGTNKIGLVEIACRGGGSLISSDIVKWVSGVDLYEILFNDLRGIPTDVRSIPALKRNALLHFFEYPDGIVKEIKGVEVVSSMPGVRMIRLDFKDGELIKAASDDRSRQGLVIIYANSKIELEKKIDAVYNALKVKINNRKLSAPELLNDLKLSL